MSNSAVPIHRPVRPPRPSPFEEAGIAEPPRLPWPDNVFIKNVSGRGRGRGRGRGF